MQTQPQTGQDVKAILQPVTASEIGTLAGPGGFSRGEKYYRNGHIGEAVLRGAALSALSEGSQEEPYVVTATLVPVHADAQAGAQSDLASRRV